MNTADKAPKNGLDRRSFFKKSSLAGMALLPMAGLLASTRTAKADLASDTTLSDSDVAVLQFLRAAELVEADLWGQYAELAVNNTAFRAALKSIDVALPDYIVGDHADEQSHADLITAFLINAGVTPVDISSFYTLSPVNVKGVDQTKKRLTNLTNLTIDTSWYSRYRSPNNPDFNGTFPQVVNITNRSTVPTSNNLSGNQLKSLAQTAAFHFGAIEQGGSSLYVSLLPKVTNLDVVSILGAIGPTEFYHFALFQTAIENVKPVNVSGGVVFPDFQFATAQNAPNSFQILTPNPCKFLDASLPVCSVIRPSSTSEAGAVAAASGLAASGLFAGQPQGFVDAVVMLAQAADAAARNS